MLRSTFCKGPPKFVYYNKEQFKKVLKQRLVSPSNFEEIFDTFLATLNEHAPLKKKNIRYNHQIFMSKTLRKAIMKWLKLRNTFNKKRSSEDWQNYKWQRSTFSNILKSSKKTFFETLKINEITDTRKFWKTVKPFSTDKCKITNNIILTEKNKALNKIKKISNTFNEYFTNITKSLNLSESTGNINFQNKESCKKIKENFGNENCSFETICKKDVLDLIKQLPRNKATVSTDIPVSALKKSVSAYYEKLIEISNNCIRSSTFPEIHKKSEVTPVLKKDNPTSKTDYRPVSTLSNVSKIFENLIYLQLNNYKFT